MSEESKLSADGLEVVGYCDPRNVQKMKSLDVCGFMVHDEPSMAISAPVILLSDAQRLLSQLREELAHAEQWRDLAMQFDRHRMNAMALIKAVAAGKAGSAECEVFASVPPIPGHEITAEVDQLRARLAALESQQAASVGGEDTRRTLGYSVRGNRYMIKATRGEIPSPPYDDRQIIELVDRAALSPAGGGVVGLPSMNELSNVIRSIVGWSNMGAGRLAEAICDRLNTKPQANS